MELSPMEIQNIKDMTEIGILMGGFVAFILFGVIAEYIAFYKSIGGLKFKKSKR